MQKSISKYIIFSILICLLMVSCNSATKKSEERCGDGVCDGPENLENCPKDCASVLINSQNSDLMENENISEDSVTFNIAMSITFESDISKVPGYDGSPYSEPVGYGFVELEVAFPKSGGYDLYNNGTLTLTNYEEKGPHCTLEIPDDMIGSSSPISWNQIFWDPEGRMTFESEVSYDNLDFNIVANCPPLSAPLIEYPIYKLVGIFNEEMNSLSIDLNASSHTFSDLHWGMHDTMQTNIEIVVNN